MRTDIQCLRGLAILFVFLYHLAPEFFPNGYLGVDIFFVISGFLITSLLDNKKLCLATILDFYFRRIRRIMPLYYLTITSVVIGYHKFLFESWWSNNLRYSLSSLLFATNQLIIHDSGDYFKEFLNDGSSMNAFIHFWSLAVEVQYYATVPFLFFILSYIKGMSEKLLTSCIFTAIGCLIYPFINSHFSFNFMPLRLWQFSSGSIAYYLENDKKRYSSPTILAVTILGTCLLPVKIDTTVLRPLITISSAFLLSDLADVQVKILQSSTLSYTGNLSYVIYLIHWPMIVFFSGANVKAKVLVVVSTLIISIFIHHCFESQFRRMELKRVGVLLLGLITLNIALQWSVRNHTFWRTMYPEEIRRLIEENKHFEDWHSIEHCKHLNESAGLRKVGDPFSHCAYPKGTGNRKILLVGNSYVLNQVDLIHEIFAGNFSEFRYLCLYENMVLTTIPTEKSKKALAWTKEIVEEFKPDVLFIIARYYRPLKEPIKNVTNDALIEEMNENLEYYERFSKTVKIMGVLPKYPTLFLSRFMQFLVQRKEDLQLLHMSKKESHREMNNLRLRLEHLNCKNCQVYELGEFFTSGDKYLTYDEKKLLSYIDNTIHFTQPALEIIKPFYEQMIKGL